MGVEIIRIKAVLSSAGLAYWNWNWNKSSTTHEQLMNKSQTNSEQVVNKNEQVMLLFLAMKLLPFAPVVWLGLVLTVVRSKVVFNQSLSFLECYRMFLFLLCLLLLPYYLSFTKDACYHINFMKIGGPSYLLWVMDNYNEFCSLASKITDREVRHTLGDPDQGSLYCTGGHPEQTSKETQT